MLDLSTIFAVPYMGGLLADFGAEVIKVEAPGRLDQTRSGWGACFDNDPGPEFWNRMTTFHQINRGKRALSLNLDTEPGREVLRGIVGTADVVLDNFTPRVHRKWGTTYDDLRALKPDLIMLSNTGYGSTGPWASFKAQGTALESTMGVTTYSGYPGGKPSKIGQSYPDFLACWAGLISVLAALVHRERTGEGQWIDLAMYPLGACVIPEAILHYQAAGEEQERIGARDFDALVSGVFPAAGRDRWLAVSVPDSEQMTRLARVVPGLPTEPDDVAAVEKAIGEWARVRDDTEAATELQEAGIAAAPVQDVRELFADPQLRSRGFFERAHFDEVGSRPLMGRPYRWESGTTEVHVRGPGPRWGEANSYVLRGLLGYDDARVQALYDREIVTERPLNPGLALPHELESLVASGVLAYVDEDSLSNLGLEVPSVSPGA